MKTRDFHNSSAPVLRDPHSGALHVAPPLTAGAEIRRPIGHGGAQPNPAPGMSLEPSSSSERPTEPPSAPDPLGADELEQCMTAMVPAMRAAATPSSYDRLVGVCCTVLESDYAMGVLTQEAERAERAAGGVSMRASSSALAALVVGFADEVLRRAETLIGDREATTKP